MFRPTGAAVAAPGTANITGRLEPSLYRISPLGTDLLYLLYLGSRPPPGVDQQGKREIFGQKILLSTGLGTGSRAVLNTTANEGKTAARSVTMSNGRAALAWFDDDKYKPLPGRLISATGAPQPANLSFACCGTVNAQMSGLESLGTGLLGIYRDVSLLQNKNELYGRIYKADGKPLSAPKKLSPGDDLSPGLRALKNGQILYFHSVTVAGKRRLVGQLYSQAWQPVGAQKTLIADLASTVAYTLSPMNDGGVLLARTNKAGSTFTFVIQRLNANLAPVASSPNLTLPAEGSDALRLVAISDNRAVALYRNTASNRGRLFAQLLSY